MEDTLVNIYLGGKLGKLFGAEWNLYLTNPSPAEAIRAININTGGKLKAYLRGEAAQKYYKIALGRKDNLLGKEELKNPTGKNDIYILPTIKGKNSGIGKIIAGVVLIALTVATFGAAGPLAGGLWGVTAATWTGIGIGLGASLVLGGISQLLAPTPSFNAIGATSNSDTESRGSNIFQGNASTTTQGGAVGLVYGRALVAPMPISISYVAQKQGVPDSFAQGNFNPVNVGGGIIDYQPETPNPDDGLPQS